MSAIPTSASLLSASVPAQTQGAPSSSASTPASSSVSLAPASVSASLPSSSPIASQSLSVSSVSSAPGTAVSTSSARSSSSSLSTFSTLAGASGPGTGDDGAPQNNTITVIIPIVAVTCGVVILYFAYRLYLLHKRRKDDQTPLPPPRTPAILEQGNRQSVMYTHSQAPPASYRHSMRPPSLIYAPSPSNSSLALSKGQYTSGSGNSTPTHPPNYTDEVGRFSPLPPPSIRAHSRPHSVASFTSARHSMYGTPTLRGTSYLNRVDIVLPQPLAPQGYTSTTIPRQRHSMYSPTSNPELRHSVVPPLTTTSLSPPSSYNEVTRDEGVYFVPDAQRSISDTHTPIL